MAYIGKVTDTAGTTHLVGSMLYGTCSTGASTAAKVVTLSDFSKLETGVTIHVKFTNSNTASNATLNVNSTGAKNLCSYGTTRVGTTERTSWKAGAVVSFTYDGTSWVMNDYIPDTGDTNTDTKVTQTGINDNAAYPILLKASPNETSETDSVNFADSTGKTSYPALNPSTGNLTHVSVNGVSMSKELLSYGFSIGTGASSISVPNAKNYTLGAACEKAVDTSISAGSTSTNLPTSQAVAAFVSSQVAGLLQYQGTISDVVTTGFSEGDYWIASGSFTIPATTGTGAKPAIVVEAGDMIIANQDVASGTSMNAGNVDAVQTNIETLTTTEIDALWAAA